MGGLEETKLKLTQPSLVELWLGLSLAKIIETSTEAGLAPGRCTPQLSANRAYSIVQLAPTMEMMEKL